MGWLEPFAEIGKIILIIASACWNFIMWSGSQIEKFAGPVGKYFFLVITFIVIPFIITTQFIAKTQAGVESWHSELAGFFLKLLAVAFMVFLISFVLSQM